MPRGKQAKIQTANVKKCRPMGHTIVAWLVLMSVFSLAACTIIPKNVPRPVSYAISPDASSALGLGIEMTGLEYLRTSSGFLTLEKGAEALRWRLALTDMAEKSIDAQYYIWHADASGLLLLSRLLSAADRGVRVRILIDDFTRIGADWNITSFNTHPHIEVRIFNPFQSRSRLRIFRGLEFLFHIRRLNHRMHNKLFVADNKVAIVGGRNIGNEYFGLNKDMNFRDLDLLAAGRIVTDISDSFDVYWNSKWSYPIEVVSLYRSGKDDLARIRDYLQKRIAKKRHYLAQIGTEVRDWKKEIYRLGQRLIQGQARIVYDLPPQGDEIRPKQTAQEILRHARAAESEVLIVSPYFIPTAKGVERLHEVVSRGVRVRILTNSLASNDILIANTAYKRYRKGLVKAGVELYELRADAAQKSLYDTAPVKADYLGLHAKTIVIDQKKVYVGTMNLDPRSLNLNTEVGLIVESPHLATQIQRSFERDLLPQNSWRVELDENDRVIWKSSAGTRLRQPAKNFRQWIKDALLTPFADEDQW